MNQPANQPQPRRRCTIREVLTAAENRWPQIFAALAPANFADALEHRGGSRHVHCPVHGGENGDAFRCLPDFDKSGGCVCNSCGTFPSGLLTLVWANNWHTDDAVARIAEFLGIDEPRKRGRPPKAKPVEQTTGQAATTNGVAPTTNGVVKPANKTGPKFANRDQTGPEVAARRAKIIARWNESLPDDAPAAAGRIAAYLQSRGLTLPPPPTLRLHPSLTYFEEVVGQTINDRKLLNLGDFPCLLAIVTGRSNGIVALHRTWLTADITTDGAGKAQVNTPKKLSTPIFPRATTGAAIRLYPHTADQPLALTEGIETALAVHQATGVAVWSCVSANGLSAIDLPDDIRTVQIWADPGEAGETAAATAANRLTAEGRTVYILTPSTAADDQTSPTDWLDVLRDQGAETLTAALAAAKPVTPTKTEPIQVLIHTEEHRVVDETIQALAADEHIYCRGGNLVHVVRDSARNRPGLVRPANAPKISPLPEYRLRERITARVRCVRKTADGDFSPIHPPAWLVKEVESRADWPGIRHLESVVETPVIKSDGSIVDKPGYDVDSGILFDAQSALALAGKSPTAEGTPFPVIPIEPTTEHITAAVATILELVCDFPFSTPEHRAAFVAALITPLARHAFRGPAPLFLIDANVRGAGKSLLCDLVAIVVSGRDMARMVNTQADDEMRKRITATAIGGDPLVLIDNIGDSLGTPSLDAALTATTWNDRILGSSQNASPPLLCTWYATGNNVQLKADIARRVCHIRLESPDENPEIRAGFTHDNIRQYATAQRPKIVAACLTLLRAFINAGKPYSKLNLKPWGSFEGWSNLVRGAIVFAGLPDPGLTREEIQSDSDTEAIGLSLLLAAWESADPTGRGLTAAEALKIAANAGQNNSHQTTQFDSEFHRGGISEDQENASPEIRTPAELLRAAIFDTVFNRDGKLPSPKSLSKVLSKFKGRVRNGKCFTKTVNREATIIWFAKSVDRKPDFLQGLNGLQVLPQQYPARVPTDNSINGVHGIYELNDARNIEVAGANPAIQSIPATPVQANFVEEFV